MIYEAHVKGISKLNPSVPEELRGTYAGSRTRRRSSTCWTSASRPSSCCPCTSRVSEQRLIKQGLTNYWGYNTLNFFTPHAAYASREAQFGGTGAVLREFKGMVRLLHEAGLEVMLDVVYNHTAEEGVGGPTTRLRGLDNANYYRQTETATTSTSPAAATPSTSRCRPRTAWCSTRCATGRTRCRSTASASTSPRRSDATPTHEFEPEHPLLLDDRRRPAARRASR